MGFAIDSALFQWDEGERRIGESPQLYGAVRAVVDELRRRLGSTFTLAELARLYDSGTDWAVPIAVQAGAGSDAAWAVRAAFRQYAREAADYR